MTDAARIVMRIDGIPKPQPRVKAYVRGNHAGVYTPGTAKSWENCVALEAKQHQPPQPITGPVCCDIVFVLPRPKGHFSSGKKGGLSRSAPVYWHTVGGGSKYGGDADNFRKLVLDVLTHCGFWRDDGQVCDGLVRKRWCAIGERPGALVVVTPLPDESPNDWLAALDREMGNLQLVGQDEPFVAPVAEVPPPSDYGKFVAIFCRQWEALHGQRYPFAGGKDGKAAATVWMAIGQRLELVAPLLAAYFGCEEPFFQGHDLSLLAMRVTKFMAMSAGPALAPPTRNLAAEFKGLMQEKADGPPRGR